MKSFRIGVIVWSIENLESNLMIALYFFYDVVLPTGVPHSIQKLLPAGILAPQDIQNISFSIFVPHLPQNLAESGNSVPHFLQIMVLPPL